MVGALNNHQLYNRFEVIPVSKYGLTNRTRISNAVDSELYKQLTDLSKQTMIPVSKLLDRAVQLVLEEYKRKP